MIKLEQHIHHIITYGFWTSYGIIQLHEIMNNEEFIHKIHKWNRPNPTSNITFEKEKKKKKNH